MARSPAPSPVSPFARVVLGPDGLPGTSDDGLIVETFDTDRDGDGVVSVADQPNGTPNVHNDTIGVTVRTTPGGIGGLAGIGCGGFIVPPAFSTYSQRCTAGGPSSATKLAIAVAATRPTE